MCKHCGEQIGTRAPDSRPDDGYAPLDDDERAQFEREYPQEAEQVEWEPAEPREVNPTPRGGSARERWHLW